MLERAGAGAGPPLFAHPGRSDLFRPRRQVRSRPDEGQTDAMTEQVCQGAEPPQCRAGARFVWRLLDWLLLGALIGALVGVITSNRFLLTSDYDRWSLSAFLFGM